MSNHLPPTTAEQLRERDISTVCPYCSDTIALLPAHHPVIDSYKSYFVAYCPNRRRRSCRAIFAVYDPSQDRIVECYPIPSFQASSVHEAIPLGIREDWAEGRRCLYAKSHKAAVSMCRRVVEALACDKLGAKAKNSSGETRKLFELIDLLHKEGQITTNIKDSAHELRHFGNYGAHVQDDGLDKVEREEAEAVRKITGQLLNTIYIGPFETQELRKKRTTKGKPKARRSRGAS